MRMPKLFAGSKAGGGGELLLIAPTLGGAVKNPVRNSSRTPALDRLADMPQLQVSEVQFAIGASHRQVAQLADRIERTVMVATVRVVIGNLGIGRHALPHWSKERHW
jgi:hypothetical protein